MLFKSVECGGDRIALNYHVFQLSFDLKQSCLVRLVLDQLITFKFKSFFLNTQFCESIPLREHLVLDLFQCQPLFFQKTGELLLVEKSVCLLLDPVFDRFNVHSIFFVFFLLLSLSSSFLLKSAFLNRFQLTNLLVHQLVSLLQVGLKFIHSLIFVSNRLLDSCHILSRCRFKFMEPFLPVLALSFIIIAFFFYFLKFSLQCFHTCLRHYHRFLDRLLFSCLVS